jgi:hypothetical protein
MASLARTALATPSPGTQKAPRMTVGSTNGIWPPSHRARAAPPPPPPTTAPSRVCGAIGPPRGCLRHLEAADAVPARFAIQVERPQVADRLPGETVSVFDDEVWNTMPGRGSLSRPPGGTAPVPARRCLASRAGPGARRPSSRRFPPRRSPPTRWSAPPSPPARPAKRPEDSIAPRTLGHDLGRAGERERQSPPVMPAGPRSSCSTEVDRPPS